MKTLLGKIAGSENKFAITKGPYDDREGFQPDNPYTHSEKRYRRVLEAYAKHEKAKLGGPSKKWAVQACQAAETARRDAGNITVPVLLISAGDDKIVTATGQKQFCDTLNAARRNQCTFVRIDGARHELFIEGDEFRVPAVTRILEFFKTP